MNNVGKEIKSLRISKKISISKITKELNISKNIIDMIENDQIDHSYDIVFYIGHLRSYCNLLEIDSNQFVERFKKQISFKKNVLNYKLEKPIFNNNSLRLRSFFPTTLVFFIFISFYFLFIKEDNNSREFALIPDLPEDYVPIVEYENISKLKDNNIKNSEYDKMYEENFDYTSAVASNKVNQNINSDEITLRLLKPTWLQIRDKSNNIILSKLMDTGEEYKYNMSLQYNITAGNAGNILVIINQDVIGKIGKFGEVIDSVTLDNSFKN
tara:strand:- start:157 stop:963 length:807 start_codon:yes stop_codon:yes gene_type:complete